MDAQITNIARACYQCGRCAGGCPMAFAMDHTPRLLIRLIQLGYMDDALNANTFWLCATCYSCTTYCPRGIDIADLMMRLKRVAETRGILNSNVWFYREFVENVRKRGIVFEPELMLAYARRVGMSVLLPHVEMGLRLARRGELALAPGRIDDAKSLTRMIQEILAQGSAR
ncbi:MAG: 4Fe-4S dicluster domain-containing protein [Chloroflexi bacterium]|nr:4Fe-4S dicluster domain-containing protein [Chloroflexota bacterium]